MSFSKLIFGLALFSCVVDVQAQNFAPFNVGSSGSDNIRSVTTDSDGNVIMTGTFEGTVTFGTTTVTSTGGEDVFVWKVNANGDHQWLVTNTSDVDGFLTTDDSGNVYLFASFNDT